MKDDKYKVGLRLYAVYQVSIGKSSRQLEELYNTSFKQIRNWVTSFDSNGIEGLRDKKRNGRTGRLTPDQIAQLQKDLLSTPDTGLESVNPLTGQLTVSFAERGNYQSFKKHLKKVWIAYRDAISIIYVDNVRYHHARKLNNFLEKHPKLQIRYLPAYSPDMNPFERL